MIGQEQVLPESTSVTGVGSFQTIRRVRNLWIVFAVIVLVLSILFAVFSLEGVQSVSQAPAGPQVGWENQDHTQNLSTRDYLRSTDMLFKWMVSGVALVLGAIEISLAITLYMRALIKGRIKSFPGRRLVPNFLRSADRRYIHEQMPQDLATGYIVLSGLALGSFIIAIFLILDSTTWILAAMVSGNW